MKLLKKSDQNEHEARVHVATYAKRGAAKANKERHYKHKKSYSPRLGRMDEMEAEQRKQLLQLKRDAVMPMRELEGAYYD